MRRHEIETQFRGLEDAQVNGTSTDVKLLIIVLHEFSLSESMASSKVFRLLHRLR